MTPRMRDVLLAMRERERDEPYYGMTGNVIGHAVGFRVGSDRYARDGRMMGAANRVIGCLQALERGGLIRFAPRGDRLSGTAYRLTEAGRKEADKMAEDKVGENMEPLDNPGDASFDVGQRVVMPEGHDVYPGEEVEIVARGKGKGFYGGSVVYDILADGSDESYRVRESEIAGDA